MISVIVPIWNEKGNIIPFLEEITKFLINEEYEIIFVCDPCTDGTEKIIENKTKENKNIKFILMSRRFGQPMATLAGLEKCNGDCAIVMDVDMQDPPSLLPKMIDYWRQGFYVVLPKRKARYGENPIRLLVAKFAYKLIDRFSEINMPRNVSDFRLIDREIINHINNMNESHGYLRGMVAYAGYDTKYLEFDRPKRLSGNSKYNSLIGSIKIGGNGVFAYSTLGLSIIFNVGILLGFGSLIVAIAYLIIKLLGTDFPLGNPTIVISIYAIGAINTLALAIIGQYIERIYEETRQRQRYIIRKTVNL